MEKSLRPWHGETGHIDKGMLAKYIGDLTSPIFYIVGPPAMVDALRNVLNAAGVNTDNIRTEEFTGY
jgi:ferredoxin-NADP reductase